MRKACLPDLGLTAEAQRPRSLQPARSQRLCGKLPLRRFACAALLSTALPALAAPTNYPSWWIERGVIATNVVVTNDYAGVNAGQLKWITVKAKDELDQYLPGGAGSNVTALISGFTPSNNYHWVNLGQLKNAAGRFWERLIAEGYATNYPWTSVTNDDCNYAAANIGQLKRVFAFDLRLDTDRDSMPDWWELRNGFSPSNTADSVEDPDGDGFMNRQECQYKTDPKSSGSVPSPFCRYVSPSGTHTAPYTNWATAATNIQSAINVASQGEMVLVTNGTYTVSTQIVVTNGIWVKSVNGATATVVRASGTNRCFWVHGPLGRLGGTVDGFDITGGVCTNDFGAGVRMSDGTLCNCRIYGNAASGAANGGGVGITGWGDVVQNCMIYSNSAAEDGGGIFVLLAGHQYTRNCAIYGNTALHGGGIYAQIYGIASNVYSIESCTIKGNVATSASGGGIYLWNIPGYDVPMTINIRDTISHGNVGADAPNYVVDGAMTTRVSYCCIAPLVAGTNNIADDPQFAAGSWQLTASSPCIDAGESNGVIQDAEGENRWNAQWRTNVVSVWDIGADEFVAAVHPRQADFETGKVGRVMISTYHDEHYYTAALTTSSNTPAQTEDRKVIITAHLPPAYAGSGVYFRVVSPDPDDLSSYETNALGGDNRDTNIVAGVLSATNATATLRCIGGRQVASAEVVLSITDHCAGDNYQVEYSLLPSFTNIVDKTEVLTAWKRVYVEEDEMYRAGADLASDFTPDSNSLPDAVTVVSRNYNGTFDFTGGSHVVIFDADHPVGEGAVVSSTVSNASGMVLYLDTDLTNSYNAGYATGDRGAAVAIPDPDNDGVVDVYQMNTTFLTNTFGGDTSGYDGGCFVEFMFLTNGATRVPYSWSSDPANFWSTRYTNTISMWFSHRGETNVLYLLGVATLGMHWGLYGFCVGEYNASVMCVESIEIGKSWTFNGEAVAHEFGHQWVESRAVDLEHPHVWGHGGVGSDYCVMDYGPDPTNLPSFENGATEFCIDGPNHLYEIRDKLDGI